MDRRLNEETLLVNEDKVPYLSFDALRSLDFIRHGFSTKLGGVSRGCYASMNLGFDRGDDSKAVLENYSLLAASAGFKIGSAVATNQWHTVNVRRVDGSFMGQGITSAGTDEEIDGQITDTPGVTLLVYGADCTPVFLADPVRKAIGLCHSGWKGTLADISSVTVKAMNKEFGSKASDLIAVIGPSICGKCYEVSEDVASAFSDRFGGYGSAFEKGVLSESVNEGHYMLDLWQTNRLNLLGAGLADEHIFTSCMCTRCHPELFFSHRRDGSARGTMAGFMQIKE